MDPNCIGITLGTFLYLSHLGGVIFMSVYSFVPEVATLRLWLPSILSILADIVLISTLFWRFLLKPNLATQRCKLSLISSWLLQLVSLITLLILNDGTENSVGYYLGSDVDAQEKIMEVTSSSINVLFFLTHSAILFR